MQQPLRTGYPQLDAYGEARRAVAHASIDGYYRHARAERKRAARARRQAGSGGGATDDDDGGGGGGGGAGPGPGPSDVDAAARDAVRCLEHAMVVVAGEKSVYRCVVASHATATAATSTSVAGGGVGSREYRDGLKMAYSHVVAAVVDRAMDIIETAFLKDARTATPPVFPSKDGAAVPAAVEPNSEEASVRV